MFAFLIDIIDSRSIKNRYRFQQKFIKAAKPYEVVRGDEIAGKVKSLTGLKKYINTLKNELDVEFRVAVGIGDVIEKYSGEAFLLADEAMTICKETQKRFYVKGNDLEKELQVLKYFRKYH